MSFIQKALYFLSSVVTLVLIGLIEFFFISYFIDMISTDWLIKLIIYICSLVLINPFIGIYIINKIPFKVKGITNIDELKLRVRA